MLLFKVPPIISQFQPMQPNYSLMGFPKPVPPPAVSVPQPHQILRDMTPFLGEAWTHCMYHSALEEEEEEIIKPMIHPHLLVLIPNVSEVINHVYRCCGGCRRELFRWSGRLLVQHQLWF